MSLRPPSPTTTVTVVAALQHLPDPRENRGKRHELAFVRCGVILAIMAGRSRVSAIPRFLRNRCGWLRELTQAGVERCSARAQLPRLLARVEWSTLQPLLWTQLGIRVESPAPGEWIAIDGKALRGSPGEQVVRARSHQSGCRLAHQPLSGPKRNEVTTVGALLAQPPLAGRKVTLDARHCNPLTTAQAKPTASISCRSKPINPRSLLPCGLWPPRAPLWPPARVWTKPMAVWPSVPRLSSRSCPSHSLPAGSAVGWARASAWIGLPPNSQPPSRPRPSPLLSPIRKCVRGRPRLISLPPSGQ